MANMENTDFKSNITNVVALKNFIDSIVDEIKSGEYNPEIIKKLSSFAEEILDIDSLTYKFKPSSFIVDNISETHASETHASETHASETHTSDTESDVEMEDDDDGPQFLDNTDDLDAEFEKLQELINRRPAIVKKTDKLAEEFLNNTISYSKNIHTKCDFYKSCISY
jgi:hypothetical protein